MANGLDMDRTGFGSREGAIYRNDSFEKGETDENRDGWFFYIGSLATKGPFATKAVAVYERDLALRKLDGQL